MPGLGFCQGEAVHGVNKALGYNSSHDMQLLGNLRSFYVMLTECDGTMGIVTPPSLHMTHVPHDEAKSSWLSSDAPITVCIRLP